MSCGKPAFVEQIKFRPLLGYCTQFPHCRCTGDDGLRPSFWVLYTVFPLQVEAEKANPNSQRRVPNGQRPHMWGQSLYILSRLMYEVGPSISSWVRRLTPPPHTHTHTQHPVQFVCNEQDEQFVMEIDFEF